MAVAQELNIDSSATAFDMMSEAFGHGIQIISAQYTGAVSASGFYSGGDQVSAAFTPSDTGVILSTGRASDVTNAQGDPNTSAGTTTVHGTSGDSQLSEIAGAQTFDAAVLEAIFVPDGSTLTMQVVFASEEYLEYVGSGFNDAVGVFINGEKALLGVGDGDITVDNINDSNNENLYVDNARNSDTFNTEMDGFTITLTLKAPVKPGEENSIKIAIADAGDAKYDSNLLIAGGSVQTALVAVDDHISLAATGAGRVDALANDHNAQGGTLTITEINGCAVQAGDSVTLASGEVVTLAPDGTFSISGSGSEQQTAFSYLVEDGLGSSAVAFVTVTTTPCFVAGTYIDTPTGPRTVETLRVNDHVRTRDSGYQPILWIGIARRPARGVHAPITIEKNRFGRHGNLLISPQHRIVVRSPRAQLLFGERDVLVKAKDLVDAASVQRCESDGDVRYFHLYLDDHEILFANGLETESYQPGECSLSAFDVEVRAQIVSMLSGRSGGYGSSARRSLSSHEARVLLA